MKSEPASSSRNSSAAPAGGKVENRIVKRFGGRHLIFRTRGEGWPILPRPYLIVSSFRGAVWVFYGVGQIWMTHRKIGEISGWIVRAPRFASGGLLRILDGIKSQLDSFIQFCNLHGIQGTVVIEKDLIEFHWTFGDELEREELKPEHASELDEHFQTLVDGFNVLSKTGV